MSSSKKDPSLRVAANDPHLVSLGGGRLSTAVTIHNIPVGDCTIGSSTQCSVSLSGAGVKPVHCTIYRSEENQVTLVPEREARLLIDGQLVETEVDLRQGAMITIGDSYYLRYNNPAEALQMRSAMGDNAEEDLDYFYDKNINPALKNRLENDDFDSKTYENIKKPLNPVDFMGWQCPKVFTADLVTVNMPAKDVLGQKYANFAKNLAENHRKDKNINVHNTNDHIYNNIPLNKSTLMPTETQELTAKVNNTSTPLRHGNDILPPSLQRRSLDKDHLDDMLKICSEYTDRQDRSYGNYGSGSLTSSPIVQNRIKTNGSLPRDKKSPFQQDLTNGSPKQNSLNNSNCNLSQSPKSSGYENVKFLQNKRVEIVQSAKSSSSGYENVKLVPQSPRCKIRTNCLSPKKDSQNSNIFNMDSGPSQTNYEDLIKRFEEKFQKEIEAIEECSRNPPSYSLNHTPILTKRTNKNINNLTIDIKSFVSPYNSPKLSKKPTPAPRYQLNKSTNSITTGSLTNLPTSPQINHHDKLQNDREDLLRKIQLLKTELNALQQQDNESLIEMDMENALVLAELQSLHGNKLKLQEEYKNLQQQIHRLEAQRNATRVMEENQQAKLKNTIEMKQDQVEKLKERLQQKPDNKCLKEELGHVKESLENDKKSFEDLEFQYLEGESEWHSYQEDLQKKDSHLKKQLEECQLEIENLEKEDKKPLNDQHRRLSQHLLTLIKDLQQCEAEFSNLEEKLSLKINSNSSLTNEDHKSSLKTIRQSLIGSTEMLFQPKSQQTDDLMSKSVNENLIYHNNKIDFSKTSREKDKLTLNKTKDLTNNAKSEAFKLQESIKDIERQRKLLNTQQGERNLINEKRKIQELIEKLNSTQNNKQLDLEEFENDNSNPSSAEWDDLSPSTCQSPLTQRAKTLNVYGNSPSPLSISETGQKLSPSFKQKPPSVSSPDSSPRSFHLDDKRSSSVLSNELSSQGDSSSISCERKKLVTSSKHQRPLTRYLPIFAEDLDLKRHIESAGHPLTLCPYVFLDAYSCRGYLHKLGSTFHTWSKRWFVLDRQRGALIYYADKSERKPRGGAYFSSIDEVYMDHLNNSKSSRPHCTFIVKTKKRSYYLQAASDTSARIWIDAIITGAQGNIDY